MGVCVVVKRNVAEMQHSGNIGHQTLPRDVDFRQQQDPDDSSRRQDSYFRN